MLVLQNPRMNKIDGRDVCGAAFIASGFEPLQQSRIYSLIVKQKPTTPELDGKKTRASSKIGVRFFSKFFCQPLKDRREFKPV